MCAILRLIENQRRQGGGGIGRGKRLIGNLETGITG